MNIVSKTNLSKVQMKLILGVVKRNSLFLHEIERKNNGFLFTTPNIITRDLADSNNYIIFAVLNCIVKFVL